MIKFSGIILTFIFLTSCSLDSKSGLWTQGEKIVKEEKEKQLNTISKKLFEEEEVLKREINPQLKINLRSKLINNSFINNFDNNNGRINYNGNLKSISRFKFSKIDNFQEFEPEIVFDKDGVIFFDSKGSIFRFNELSKLVWKKNFYSKSEKKHNPTLFFGNNKKVLVVTDNLAKFYAMNIDNGELLWKKNHLAPFNSQVKVYKDRFFVIDLENILRCFSLLDGKELWNIKTEQTFIKSQKKLSIIIINETVYFDNSMGDITAVDVETGNLKWQTPTQINLIEKDSFTIKTSDLIANNDTILFSNNDNNFFSLDINTGLVNWIQKVNSNLQPTLIDNLVFAISMEGYLVIMDNISGKILRSTNIFKDFKIRKIKWGIKPQPKYINFMPIGFIVGSKNIYLTTDHGRLFIIDIITGKTTSVIKIDNEKISRPFILNQNLYIIKKNAIIKLN